MAHGWFIRVKDKIIFYAEILSHLTPMKCKQKQKNGSLTPFTFQSHSRVCGAKPVCISSQCKDDDPDSESTFVATPKKEKHTSVNILIIVINEGGVTLTVSLHHYVYFIFLVLLYHHHCPPLLTVFFIDIGIIHVVDVLLLYGFFVSIETFAVSIETLGQ